MQRKSPVVVKWAVSFQTVLGEDPITECSPTQKTHREWDGKRTFLTDMLANAAVLLVGCWLHERGVKSDNSTC